MPRVGQRLVVCADRADPPPLSRAARTPRKRCSSDRSALADTTICRRDQPCGRRLQLLDGLYPRDHGVDGGLSQAPGQYNDCHPSTSAGYTLTRRMPGPGTCDLTPGGLLSFLREHTLAVESSVSPTGSRQSAVVGFVVT